MMPNGKITAISSGANRDLVICDGQMWTWKKVQDVLSATERIGAFSNWEKISTKKEASLFTEILSKKEKTLFCGNNRLITLKH